MENMISVTQFSTYVKQIFSAEELLQNILIYGEVSDLKISRGTAYFSLKDSDALLPCVMFNFEGQSFCPQEGDMVTVRGSPNYYIKGGRFSFVVYEIKAYGLGLIYQQFLEMKNKLEKEGLFNKEIKKPLPKNIKKIGVITSETGAVIQDIIDISRRRNPMLSILLFPAKVQGIGAENTIISGLKELDKTDVDVIIIARGGGSLEDLSPFNTEAIARAIYETEKMVISAVGHETDFTIADFVADLRAPTPSAAAELVSVDTTSLYERMNITLQKIEQAENKIITNYFEKLNNLTEDIIYHTENYLTQKYLPLKDMLTGIKYGMDKFLTAKEQNFKLLLSKIELNNPISILSHGYASVEKQQKRITKLEEVKIGDEIVVNLSDGNIFANVTKKEKNKWLLSKMLKG